MNNTISSCVRCGQCCIKGGPALHNEDLILIRNNVLPFNALFTIRAGEPVYHPVEARLIPAPTELIKIKGVAGSWACVFFDSIDKACGIYEERPIECRNLKCWDTKDAVGLFMNRVLSRKTIIQNDVLEEIISAYEDRFPIPAFMELIDGAIMHTGDVSGELKKIISVDSSFRNKFMECFGFKEAEMDFLFGRSLKSIALAMGISVV